MIATLYAGVLCTTEERMGAPGIREKCEDAAAMVEEKHQTDHQPPIQEGVTASRAVDIL